MAGVTRATTFVPSSCSSEGVEAEDSEVEAEDCEDTSQAAFTPSVYQDGEDFPEVKAVSADPVPKAKYADALARLEKKKAELVELDKSWFGLGQGWGDRAFAKDTASFLTGVLNQFDPGTPFRSEFDGKIRDVQDLPFSRSKHAADRTSNGIYVVYDAAIDLLRQKLGRPVQTDAEKP